MQTFLLAQNSGFPWATTLFIGLPAVLALFLGIFFLQRYRRCPSNRILVIYGKVGGATAKCIHGGGRMVWPVIQDYQYMSLEPMTIEIDLSSALSKKNIRVNVPSTFTIGISTEQEIMQNAAERLLGLPDNEIARQARDVILGQMRLVIATLAIEEINQDREKFLDLVNKYCEGLHRGDWQEGGGRGHPAGEDRGGRGDQDRLDRRGDRSARDARPRCRAAGPGRGGQKAGRPRSSYRRRQV
jgi:flotillin